MLRRAKAAPSTARRAVHGSPSHLRTMRAMAERDGLVDAIAGFALFADLTGPQLEGIVHLFEEAVFAEGEKVLRQGLTGLRLLRHPRWRGGDRRRRHGARPARPRRVLRRGLDHPRRVADRRRRRHPPAALPGPAGSARRGLPHRPPAGHVPDAPGAGAPAARREPMAELSRAVPAGRLPGRRRRQRARRAPGLVLAAAPRASTTRSSRPTRRRAGCSAAGRSSSGCCRGPSRTRRPSAGRAPTSATTGTACSATSPSCTGAPAGPDGRLVLLPVAAGDGGQPRRRSPSRRRVAVRYGCRWTGDAPGRAAGRRPVRGRDDRRRLSLPGRSSSRSGWPSRSRRPGPGWSTATTTPTSGPPRPTPTAAS